MGTGCGHDLISDKDIPDWNRENMLEQCPRPAELHTANGVTSATEQVSMQIVGLKDDATALVLDSTPAVLSIGLRCMEKGWRFQWPAGREPSMTSPAGVVIKLRVIGNVPYLEERSPANPASQVEPRDMGPVLDAGEAPVPDDIGGQPLADDAAEELELLARDDRRDLMAEAVSLDHLMTHSHKNPHCSSCQRAKMQAKRTPRRHPKEEDVPTTFGQQVTADHMIAQDVLDESVLGDKTALVVLDRGTKWIDMFPLLTKDTPDAKAAMKEFMGRDELQSFYSDNSPELRKLALENGWQHSTSTPGRPETNGVAERAVRKVVEGTRTALEHAGLPPKWWCYAGRHFCLASNIQARDDGGGGQPTSSWQLRHKGGKFKGLRAPFGCLIDFKPSPTRIKPTAKFAPKSVPVVFVGYHFLPGGRWRGDD